MATPEQNSVDASWLTGCWNNLLKNYTATEKISPRVRRLEVSIGNISAQLNASKSKSYLVEITLPVLDDATWQTITDTLSGQALYAAQMLAGNLPVELQDVFAQSGCSLLPESLDVWSGSCSIMVEEENKDKNKDNSKDDQAKQKIQRDPTDEERAQSLAAVYTMLGNLFEEDSWLLLELHGRTRPQILQALHASRVNAEATPPMIHGSNGTSDSSRKEEYISAFYTPRLENDKEKSRSADEQDLEEQIDSFWGVPKRLKNIHHRIESPAIDLVLMRRLGPPPFNQDSLQLYEQFMTLYRQVGAKAIALAYTAETEK